MSQVPKFSVREAFLQSFIHQRYFLFGRELLPFSLRHWLLLLALNSPLISGGEVELHDLRLAVLVCSTRSNAEFFKAAKFKSLYWRIWKKFTSYAQVAHSLHYFNGYIDDYLPDFPFWQSAESTDESRVPGFFVSAARLLTGSTPEAVMNMPLGELLAWNLAKNEAEGYPNKNLMSDTEVEILRSPEFAEAP